MRNLSLQTTQNSSVTKMADVSNKTGAASDISATAEGNSVFQTMLTKQVQAQQAPAKQAEAKPAETKSAETKSAETKSAETKSAETKSEEPVSQGNAEPTVNEIKGNETKARAKVSNHAVSTAPTKKISAKSNGAEVGITENASASLAAQVKLDAKDVLKTKVEADAKTSDADVNKADTNTNDLSASTLVPAANTIPVLNTLTTPLVTSTTAQLTSDANGQTQQQRNLDMVLNNALLQNKVSGLGTNVGNNAEIRDAHAAPDTKIPSDQSNWLDAMLPSAAKQALAADSLNAKLIRNVGTNVEIQDAQVAPDKSIPSDQSNWLDAMLPGVAKQSLATDSLNAKLMLNAVKDGATNEMANKDAANKEINIPASYQPAAQINANLPTQQVGSSNSINIYPGKTGWDQAISQKVVWMVGAGEQSATLTLNPPDLGPLQVVIHVHNDQANTTFISDNPEVRQALQDGLSNLRDKMSESGIQLGQANVSSGEQSQQQFQQTAQQSLGATQFSSNASTSIAEKAVAANTLVRVSNGLVDTFA